MASQKLFKIKVIHLNITIGLDETKKSRNETIQHEKILIELKQNTRNLKNANLGVKCPPMMVESFLEVLPPL